MAGQVKADCGASLIKRSHLSTAPVRVSSQRKRVVTPFYGFPFNAGTPECVRQAHSRPMPLATSCTYDRNILEADMERSFMETRRTPRAEGMIVPDVEGALSKCQWWQG